MKNIGFLVLVIICLRLIYLTYNYYIREHYEHYVNSKINNRGRGAGKCPRTCTTPNMYKRLASIFESLQINSVYGWYFTLQLYEGRNRATS